MDFHGKKRKELQALCKEHNIPANLTNLEMANKLASLLNERDKPVTRGRSCLKNLLEIDSKADSDGVNRKIKKVRFSPKNETIESVASQKRTRLPVARKGNFSAVEDVESVEGLKEIGDIPVRVTRSRAQRLGEVGMVPLPDSPVVKTRGRRVQKGTNTSDSLVVEVKKGGEPVVDAVAPAKNLRQRNGRKRNVEVFEDENMEPKKAVRQTKRKERKVEVSELGKTEVVGTGRIMRSRTNLEVEASALHNEVSKLPRRDVKKGKSLSSQAENRNNLEGRLEVVLPFEEPSGRPRRTRGRTKPIMPPADNGDKVHGESEVGVKEPLQRPQRTGGSTKSVMPQADNGDKVQGESEVGAKEPSHRNANRGTSILPNAEYRDNVEGKLEVVLPLEEPAKRPSRNVRGKSIAPQIDKALLEGLKEYEIVSEPEGCSRHDMLVLKAAADKEAVGRNNSSKRTGGSSQDTDMFLTKLNVRRSRRNASMQEPVAISDRRRGSVSPAGKNKKRKRRIDPILEEETVEAEVAPFVEISTRRSRRDKSETVGPAVETGKSVGKKRKPTSLKSANIAAVSALHSTPAEEDAQSSMLELAGRERKAERVVPTVETGGFVGEESQIPLKSPSLEVEAPSSKATLGIETANTEDAHFSIPQLAESDIHPVSSSKKDLKHRTAGQSKKSCNSVRALKEDRSEEAGFGTSDLDKEMANVDNSVRTQTGSRKQEMEKSAGKSACTAKTDYSEEDGVGTSDLEVNTAKTSGCKSVRSQTQYRLQSMQIPVSESLVVTQDLNMPPAVDTKNSLEDCIYKGNVCDSALHSLHRSGNLGFKLAEKDPVDDSSSPGDTGFSKTTSAVVCYSLIDQAEFSVKQKELETELEPSTVNAPGSNQSGCSRKDFEDVTKVAGEAASVNPSNEHDITSVILPNNDVLVEAAESLESSELRGKVLTPGDSSIVEPRFSVPEDGESGNIENHDRIDGRRAGGTLKSCSGKERGREQGLTNVFHGPSDMNSVAVTLEKTPASSFVKLQTKSAGHVMAFSDKKLACPAAVEYIYDNEGTAGKISGSDGLVINKSDCFEVNDTVEVMEQEGASSPLRNGAVANIVGGDGITCLHKEDNLVEVAGFDETDYHKDHEILSDPNRETSIYDSSSKDKNYIKVSRERTCGDESFEGTAQTVLVSPLNAIAIAGELTENEVDACSFSSLGMTPLQANTNLKEQEDDQVDTQDTLECGMLRGNQRNNAEREETSSLAAETCDGIISRQKDFAHETLHGTCHLERKEVVDHEATYASAATDEENNVGGSEDNICANDGVHHSRQEDFAHEALDGTCHLERKEEVDHVATNASAATDEENNIGRSEENICTDDGVHHSRQEDCAREAVDGTCHLERKEEVDCETTQASAVTDGENNVDGSEGNICADDGVHLSRQEDFAHKALDRTCHLEREEEVDREATYASAATDEENNVGGSGENICIDDSIHHSLGGIDGQLPVVTESSFERSRASVPEDDREKRSYESLEREGILLIISEEIEADRAEILHRSIAASVVRLDSGISCCLVESDQPDQGEETGRQLESERFDQIESKEMLAAKESEHEKSLHVGNPLLTTCEDTTDECSTTREEDQLKAKYSAPISSSKSGKEAEGSSYETKLAVLGMSLDNKIGKGADERFSPAELEEMTKAKETKHASSIQTEISLPITTEETADGGSKSKWHGDAFKNLFSTPVDQRNLYKKTSDCDYREGWQGDQLKNLFATPVISTIGLPDTQTSSRGNSDQAMFVGSSSGMASGGKFCRGMSQETMGADGRELQIIPLKEVALPGNIYEVSRDGLDEAGGVAQVDACSTAKDCEFTETQMTSELTKSTSKCMKGINMLEEEHKIELVLPGSPIGSDIVGFDHGDEITTKYLNTPAASARDLPEECKVCDDISIEVAEKKLISAAMKADSYSKDTVDVLMDGNVLKNNDLKSSESDGNVVVVVPEMDGSAATSQKLSDKKVRNVVEVSELFDEVKNDDYVDQGQNILQDLYERTFLTLNECVSRDPANEALKERSIDVTGSLSNLNEASIGYSGELKNVGLMGGCLNIDSSLEKKQDHTNALQVSPGSFFHQLKGEKKMVSQKANSTLLSVSSSQEDEQESCANGGGLNVNAGQKMADVVQDDELNNIHGFRVPALASDEFQGYTVNALTSTSEPFDEDDTYRKKYRETMTQSDPNRGGNKGDDLGNIEVVPRERLIDTAHPMSEGAFVKNTFCETSGVPSCGNEVEVTAKETDQAQSPAHSSGRILWAEDGSMEFDIGSQTFSNWEIDIPFEGDEVGKFNARASSIDLTCEDDKDAGPNENLSVTSEDVEITLDEVWMEVDKMSGDESKDDYPQEESIEKVNLEENQPLVEEKYEDGTEAIQKQSLASFDFDEGTAEDAQTGELIERKNFDPEAEEGNNPSAKRFFSTTMKRKIAGTSLIQATPTKLFMSDFKENGPGFKREHPGALTGAKLVTNRRALEDLRKK